MQPRLWCGCCVAHDLAYWQGGSREDRERADIELRRCVGAAAGSDMLGALMRAGVRAGGQPQLPSRFRWAYGWPLRNGYVELSDTDQQQVFQRLQQHSYAEEVQLRCAVPAAASEAR